MIQGSPEWLAWRQQGIGSSDAAAILGCDPWRTAFQCWEIKTGRRTQVVTEAMARGTELEPQARAAYEEAMDCAIAPSTHMHGTYNWMRASVDGMTFDQTCIVEIKCPGETSYAAIQAEVPQHYYAQVQHQLAVTGADVAHLWVWSPNRGGFLREIAPDVPFITRMIQAELEFWNHVKNDIPPPAGEKDAVVRTDEPFLTAAAAFIEAETRLTETRALFDAARQVILSMTNGSSIIEGGGIRVSTFERRGNVDYAKIPQLKGVDLESFRKAAIKESRITVLKK